MNLSPDEKRAFSFLFNQADTDQLGVVTGERAVSFFERTRVDANVLGEIWQIADTENRGFLSKPGFCMVLRLIGHYQAGRGPSAELAFKPGPIPKFEGLSIPGVPASNAGQQAVSSPTGGRFPSGTLQPQLSGQGPIRVPPLEPAKAQQYAGLFERSGAVNGLLDGGTAKTIFEKAGLPNEVLGKIWTLSDRQQRGALDQTEFIVAMHLLMSMKTRSMTALPNNLPPGLYEAAARRGAPPPPGSRGSFPASGAVPRNSTGGSSGTPVRAQSPLANARPTSFGTPPPPQAQQLAVAPGSVPWLITPQEKARYDTFFSSIDTANRGILTGEQAVQFFSDSRLPEDTLAAIWDLADIRSEGQLNRDEFAVAMYLIGQQRTRNPPALPAFLPPALVPPSMREQPQQQKSTAPAFDNTANPPNMPKSAADDLFGLDEPSQSAAASQPASMQTLQPQTTGDPFGGSASPASPSSPQRFQPAAAAPASSTAFRPFVPTSAFGASLAQQHTGGSATSSSRGFQPPQHSQLAQATPANEDDLLGDSEATAAESAKMSNDTTELANMSNQIGNLRQQMESTQTKRGGLQQDLTATQNQKRDLELRLQQFRSQYETEVRTVKELETQLATSRESTKKLSQDLAMLEGAYQDLQTQHNSVAQALQADQQENANLKQRIGQINAEVSRLKPEIEKMKLDARQQKGLVSINKKQLSTNEMERDRLQKEKRDLEIEIQESKEELARQEAEKRSAPQPQQQEQSHVGRDAAIGAAGIGAAGATAFGAYEASKSPQASTVTSPTAEASRNPFHRKTSGANDISPQVTGQSATNSGPTPSAFDALFGPSAAFAPSGQAASRSGTPPATSFIGRSIPFAETGPSQHGGQQGMSDSMQSASSAGEPTPSATPPMSGSEIAAKDSPGTAMDPPPPPPEGRQFTPNQLPVVAHQDREDAASATSSTRVVPPASRAGGVETPREFTASPAPTTEGLPGAFPGGETPAPTQNAAKDFDEAFAGFGEGEKAKTGGNGFDEAFEGFGGAEQSREAERAGEGPFGAQGAPNSAAAGYSSEFPPIQSLEPEDEEDSSDEEGEVPRTAAATSSRTPGGGNAEGTGAAHLADAPEEAPGTNLAGARPSVQQIGSTASSLPGVEAQRSPPTYEQSAEPAFGGSGERTDSNQFPPEFDGLLPSREDPTSPPREASSPAVVEEKEDAAPPRALPERTGTGSSSLYPNTIPQTPSSTDVFHDATSRPASSVVDSTPTATAAAPSTSQQAKNAFDDFDDFDGLAEAKEAGGDEFGFGAAGSQYAHTGSGFDAAFDSPATSMSTMDTMMGSSQMTPVPGNRSLDGGFGSAFATNGNSNSSPFDSVSGQGQGAQGSIQNTPQNPQHDWDAIFSGLDSSKDVDTSLPSADGADPWSTPAATTNGTSGSGGASAGAGAAQQMGRAITPGTEHDDPILKRLTGMGYPRGKALSALEKYDYDINKVSLLRIETGGG